MVKGTITFIRYYSYDVEGEDEDECFDKAYKEFHSFCVSPIADTTYDDVEIELEEELLLPYPSCKE